MKNPFNVTSLLQTRRGMGKLKPPPLVPHPFTVFLLIITMLSGLSILCGGPAPMSLENRLPHGYIFVWAFLLMMGGFITFIGVYWRDLITGLLLEVGGCIFLVPACTSYVIIAFQYLGTSALVFPVFLVGGFGIGAIYRIRQIIVFIQAVRKLSMQVTEAAQLVIKEAQEPTGSDK